MLGDAGFKESDIPTGWKDYWSFWCDKVQPGLRTKTGQRALRHRPADGRRFQRLVLLVPDLHGCVQRQAGRRQRQAAGRRSEGEAGTDQRAQGLHRRLYQGLHAAVVDIVEGSGQQRRLPQQDDGDDAQRDHLDRREVARRCQQRDADSGAARTGEEELHGADPHGGLSQQARRREDGLSHCGQDRRDLRGSEEQEARQGVRHLPAAGGEPDAVRRGLAGTLVPGDQGGDRRARSGRPTGIASRCSTSMRRER